MKESIVDYNFLGLTAPGTGVYQDTNGLTAVFTICININKLCDDLATEDQNGKPYTAQEIATRCKRFYDALIAQKKELYAIPDLALQVALPGASPIFSVAPTQAAKAPFQFFQEGYADIDAKTDLDSIKNQLWQELLLENKTINRFDIDSGVRDQSVKEVDPLLASDDIQYFKDFKVDNNDHKAKISTAEPALLNKKLGKIKQMGGYNIEIAKREQLRFIKTYNNSAVQKLKNLTATSIGTLKTDEFSKLITKLHSDALKAYLTSDSLKIEELINNFNIVCKDPAVMRLMGLARDFRVTIPSNLVPTDGKDTRFLIKPLFKTPSKLVHFPATAIKGIYRFRKYAFLADTNSHTEKYYTNSILKSQNAEIIRFDKVGKLQGLIDHKERINSNEQTEKNDNFDALTRGLCYTHHNWKEITRPINDFKLEDVFTDEQLCDGHRVLMKMTAKSEKPKIFSLTGRSLALAEKQKKPFFSVGNFESCIHIDAAMSYYDNGEVKHTASDVLFEYAGELLTLKSAFAKGVRVDGATEVANEYDNRHDSGISRSKERFKDKVSFFTYPFTTIQNEGILNITYGIPSIYNKNFAPKLRFDNDYAFGLSQHYIGGGGLPIFKHQSLQLSVEDLAADLSTEIEIFSKLKTFSPVESKKAVTLVSRKPIAETEGDAFSQKESLHHLVIKSEGYDNITDDVTDRHILKPKIEMETAFWHNLLSPPNITVQDSFILKRKANCGFASREDYNEQKKANKQCGEGCKSYCGGLFLKKNYDVDQFNVPYFTDPDVTGIKINLFWDQEFTKPIRLNNDPIEVNFVPKQVFSSSILLRLAPKLNVNKAYVYDFRVSLDLKKGATVYAQLVNKLRDERKTIADGWWMDIKESNADDNDVFSLIDKGNKTSNEVKRLKLIHENRNAPKQIMFTHASKEPLVIPKIIEFYGTQKDLRSVGHLANYWLKLSAYAKYELGKNIIAERVDPTTGQPQINASFAKLTLLGHFERLDAIGLVEFIDNVIPTGGLELWMRKEEFNDDPENIALETGPTKHHPALPVLKMDDRQNKFKLEYKIEFDTETMSQLKSLKNVTTIAGSTNPYLAMISKLLLKFDLRSTKFEEREYYLKGISKFKGFFTDQQLSDRQDATSLQNLESYVFPKLTNVMASAEYRFRVLALNNRPPQKPEISHAVTTIAETRTYVSKQDTIVKQSGNTVTIYLKRGRLTSGKQEMVGIFVEANTIYNEVLKTNELLSTAGKDILSDRYANRNKYLQVGDIKIPNDNEYGARYEADLGLYHFLPKFDFEKQLWKFEVTLNIKTKDGTSLHNPFVNFVLVHYQPFSINYNTKTTMLTLDDLRKDCRISEIENATWCYLLPERELSVFFAKPKLFSDYGQVNATLSFNHTSLHQFNYLDTSKSPAKDAWKFRSNFMITVQGQQKKDEIIWYNLPSQLTVGGGGGVGNWKFNHPLLTKDMLDKQENIAKISLQFKDQSDDGRSYKRFRVRLVEVEWFVDNPGAIELGEGEDDIVDNENMRVRYVELIY